ncbi:MAG: prepilin-type N-terminal cleavage/methylation domain-containing protein [Deltaproteobacteria bacterium]|nr:prepilin-type N-terminal cleavage/methylation domain-containing protein [Deltaproteobacteria bacterium]
MTPYRPRFKRQGFTFLEVLVVVTLMALAAMLVLPSFENMLTRNVNWEANRLKGVIHLLRNEAVLGRKRFHLMLDLKKAEYFVEVRGEEGAYKKVDFPQELRPHGFSDSVQIEDMVMYGDARNKIKDRVVTVNVDASGFIDPFWLHLLVEGEKFTLKVEGFTGRVELLEGVVDADFQETLDQ